MADFPSNVCVLAEPVCLMAVPTSRIQDACSTAKKFFYRECGMVQLEMIIQLGRIYCQSQEVTETPTNTSCLIFLWNENNNNLEWNVKVKKLIL